jgi:peptide/nickel transport system substrate-binding protein
VRLPYKSLVPLLGLLGCLSARSRGDALVDRPLEIVVSNDAETLDPRYVTDAVGMRVTRLIHAGISRLDPDSLAPVPYLAKSWRWLDPLALRVELRSDVAFHSGAPFTSHDVVATLEAFASSAVASRHARVIDAIASTETDGEHAVVIHLKHPHATLLTDLEIPILREGEARSTPAPTGSLDGLGPFAVSRVDRGVIELAPCDHSPLPRPLHAITVRTVHDENARALRLYAGRADVALNQISPTLLPALEGRSDLAVSSRPGANLTYLVVREGRPPLDAVDVRRAISLGIDRYLIARTMLANHAEPADGAIPSTLWAYLPHRRRISFDPKRARALLAGATVHVTLLASPDRLRLSIARVVAQELAEVGIVVEVISLELGSMLARLGAGEFDLALLQLPEIAEPHVLRNFLGSQFIPPNGANRGRVTDPVVDALIDQGERELDVAQRRQIYDTLDARIADEAHIIPLWHEDQVAVTSLRARSFEPSAEGRWLGLAAIE